MDGDEDSEIREDKTIDLEPEDLKEQHQHILEWLSLTPNPSPSRQSTS